MSIGNSNYVKKHYAQDIKIAIDNFEKLQTAYAKKIGKHTSNQQIAFRIELEKHYGPHSTASHGIEFRKNREWSPKSFYGGYAYLSHKEFLDIINNEH